MKLSTFFSTHRSIGLYIRVGIFLLFPVFSFAQSDVCTAPTSISSATTCITGTSRLTGQSIRNQTPSSPTVASTCAGTPGVDVWYTFVAKTTNPTIALSAIGSDLRGSSGGTKLQILSGTCPSGFTSVGCTTGTGTTLNLTATNLTVDQTYFIRVYTNAATAASGTTTSWGYTICVTDPAPANNDCAGAVLLTPGISCTNTAGNIYGATNSAPTIITTNLPNCAGTVINDVWYRFVAHTTNPTISLSNITAGFTNPGLQLLLPVNSGSPCGASGFTSLYCGTTSIPANFLTPGTTYYIRVYSTSASIISGAAFDICIQDPVSTPPSNDECTGAVNLSVGNACSNLNGTMAGATISATPLGGSCTAPNAYDVWYKFTSINTVATITLSSIGANFLTPRIELFSGTCGSLTSIFCGASPLAATGLTAGTTYYIRVYSITAPPPNGNARFNICIISSAAPAVRFGNSYVNVSKKTTGGVVEPGDTLEIRMTINHTSPSGATIMYGLRYVDNIPSQTAMLTGTNDSIRIITNEGLTVRKYTLASGDDAATYLASPPAGEFNIRLNLGFGSSSPGIPPNNTVTESVSATGTMTAHTTGSSNDRPRGGGGVLFATAYRVVVAGNLGDTITLNPGQFVYKTSAGGADITLTSTPYKILISDPLDLCANSIGINNAAELGGTFGAGTTLNRATDLTTPIAGYSFLNNVNAYNGLGDGRYSIVKNISPRSRTNKNAGRAGACPVIDYDDPLNCNNRMHNGHWYIDGDHTGTNDDIGNLPPDETTNSGYMLMVNADYVASEVFTQTLNNLCPNTYYEFSAWFRNICPTCGTDSTGAQFTGTPTAPAAGYPGVYPNLSFALNGLDYYSTGEIDTVGWLKKGFVFRTGPSQNNATFSIRNNSQGGGGNDWVMDDIAVATCLPTMSYSPTINPNVCEASPILIADTISSYFKNYTTYKWQRSINNGASWTDITGVTTLPDTNYYITTYTVPPANTTLIDSGNLYRVVVATTAANLSDPNCNISDGVTITLSVLNCTVLDINLLSFNGKLVDSKSVLSWSTSQENSPVTFLIEKSPDGRNFSAAGELPGYYNGKSINHYSLTDHIRVNDKIWYRIVMVTAGGKKKYSATIQLKNDLPDFELSNIINPFSNNMSFNIISGTSSIITMELIDIAGKKVLSNKQIIYTGTNSINLNNTQTLPSGIYTLRVTNKDRFIVKQVVKKN